MYDHLSDEQLDTLYRKAESLHLVQSYGAGRAYPPAELTMRDIRDEFERRGMDV